MRSSWTVIGTVCQPVKFHSVYRVMRIQINFCKSKRFHDLIFNNKKYDKVFELLEVGALVLATGTPYTKIYNNKAELKMYANNLLVLGSKNFMNNDDQMTDQYEDINFDLNILNDDERKSLLIEYPKAKGFVHEETAEGLKIYDRNLKTVFEENTSI